MQMRFLGCGDVFGSGGRLNTCFLVNRGDASFLIDCGASAMISSGALALTRTGLAQSFFRICTPIILAACRLSFSTHSWSADARALC